MESSLIVILGLRQFPLALPGYETFGLGKGLRDMLQVNLRLGSSSQCIIDLMGLTKHYWIIRSPAATLGTMLWVRARSAPHTQRPLLQAMTLATPRVRGSPYNTATTIETECSNVVAEHVSGLRRLVYEYESSWPEAWIQLVRGLAGI